MFRNKNLRELIKLSKQLVQPLLPSFHKGQAGKVAVIGGCEDYTGAPFFACHSAAMVGADLNHIICEHNALVVIKLYSPDLMVHPYIYDLSNNEVKSSVLAAEIDRFSQLEAEELIKEDSSPLVDFIEKKVIPKVLLLLNRIDVVVVGPGFGRDALMLKTLVRIIEEIRVLNKPVILDADALYLLSVEPNIIANYEKAVLTPNVVEFDRLAKRLNIKSSPKEKHGDAINATKELSKALGGVTIIRKGSEEIIVFKDECLVNSTEGSLKRVGGQGDTLTGALATFINWSYNYNSGLWEIEDKLSSSESHMLACFAASSLVRIASFRAYQKHGRSMQTSNIHECLLEAFNELFDNDEFVKL